MDTHCKGVREREREAERYRLAAEDALDQLQWCVDYLYRIRKSVLAKGLKANREHIRGQLEHIAQHGPRL